MSRSTTPRANADLGAEVPLNIDPGNRVADRYEVIRTLGKGGSARAYLARDIWTNTSVALKVAHTATGRAASSVLRESALVAQLDSDRLPRFLDRGFLSDGRPYMATEFVEATSLRDVLAHYRPTITQSLLCTRSLVAGLLALHQQHLLHRDVKSGNVLLPICFDGLAFERASLMDLGIVRRLTALRLENEPTTELGDISGTPLYMAPEQLCGQPNSIATDLFSLGLVMYELIFGIVPLADVPISRATLSPELPRVFVGEFVVRRLSEQIVVPYHPDLHENVAELLQKLLSIVPDQRPACHLQIQRILDDALAQLGARNDTTVFP